MSRELSVVSPIMKLFIKLIILVIVVYVAWSFLKPGNNKEPLIRFTDQAENFSVKIRNKEKEEFKQYLEKIKRFVYREATVHNPAGDVVPDQIDDKVIQKVKEKVN